MKKESMFSDFFSFVFTQPLSLVSLSFFLFLSSFFRARQ